MDSSSENKSLIILGNGADLYCELNTTFKDFLTQKNNNNISNIYESLKAIKICDLSLKNIFLTSTYEIKNHKFLQKIYRFPIYKLLNKNISIDSFLDGEFNQDNSNPKEIEETKNKIKQEIIKVIETLETTMKDISEMNFWEILLILMDQTNGSWYDIETCIRDFLTMQSFLSEPDKSAIEYIHDSIRDLNSEEFFSLNEINNYSPLNNFNFRFIIYVIINRIINDDNNRKLCLTTIQYQSFLLDELHEFENKFSDFVISEVYKRENDKDDYFRLMNTLIPSLITLSDNDKANILSFNYTSVTPSGEFIDKFKNIHGGIYLKTQKSGNINKSNVIFGIDSNTFFPIKLSQKSIDLIYPFTKTQRVIGLSTDTDNDVEIRMANFLSNDKKESKHVNVIENNINEIVFFGHSLGESDYSYFISIFDYYKLHDSKLKLKFVFNPKRNNRNPDDNDVRNARLRQAKKISNLINRYANTLENKSHGKNLLHKLLVEDRIQIVDIRDVDTKAMWKKINQIRGKNKNRNLI
ncbi:hypothetical protein AKUH4B202J_01270 [Apilactobacillus kunkeei]|nr:hypothetical protein AKUH4B202J_01270 [Apilactobacillus kunkeei]